MLTVALRLGSDSWLARFGRAFTEKFIDAIIPGSGNIGEEIRANILQKKYHFQIAGMNLLLTDAVVVMWLAVAVLIVFGIWLGRKREMVPVGRQTVAEMMVDRLLSLCKSNGMTQKQAEEVTPFVGSICFFLVFNNIIAVFRLKPPAKNPAFPFALAFFSIGFVIFMSIRFVGVKGFFHSLLDPMKAMLPFRILDYLIKPMSLALRLFGNIFGAFILMDFVYIIFPAALPWILGLWFDLGDGILQAVVFAYLTISYIGEVLEGAHTHTYDITPVITQKKTA